MLLVAWSKFLLCACLSIVEAVFIVFMGSFFWIVFFRGGVFLLYLVFDPCGVGVEKEENLVPRCYRFRNAFCVSRSGLPVSFLK